MTPAEENALLARHAEFAEKRTADTLTTDAEPSSRLRALVKAAFRAGWMASRAYADQQWGPG